MFCPKCGAEVVDGDQYCGSCGQPLTVSATQEGQSATPVDTNGHASSPDNLDERLIKAYIGPKADRMYDSVKNGGINIWAILFGIAYFAYRKMYLVSACIIVASLLLMTFIPSFGQFTSSLIGLMFCPLYKWDITRKLKKMKLDNPGATEDELLARASEKGGTSWLGMVGFLGVYILVTFILVLIFE